MPETTPTPRRGLRFRHMRHLTATASKANPEYEVCEVTMVRRGTVYYGHYRPGQRTHGSWYLAAEKFPTIVREVLDA